ncbi:MAG: S9 family peptidase [Halanaerobiales bacterium]|nr:S9 family peptidase [Halanaerobiales bacterium]
MNKKRKINAEDLYLMKFVSDPQISPAGNEVAFTLTTVNEEKDYQSQIFLVNEEGKQVQLTNTTKVDSMTRWAPLGNQLAFISNRSGERQIWLINRHGGEAKQLTQLHNGVIKFDWAPDGKRIALFSEVAQTDEMETLLREKTDAEKEKERKESARKVKVIDNLSYKADGRGFLTEKKSHVWIVGLDGGDPVQVTTEERNYFSATWSPDGKKLALVSEIDDPDYKPGEIQIQILDLSTKKIENIISEGFMGGSLTWSPDGSKIAFYGNRHEHKFATLNQIWISDLTDGTLKRLAVDQELTIGDYCMSDLRAGGTIPGPQWSFDGQFVYSVVSAYGNSAIYSIGLDGSIEKVVGGERQIFGFSMDVDRIKIAFAYTDSLIPGDLAIFDLITKTEKQLTQINKELLEELVLAQPEEVTFTGADDWEILGWYIKPVDFEEGKVYPTVLEIHGGPHAMYSNSFFHEFQLLAAHGYGVIYCNPRGSQGYGQKFANGVIGDYGGKDYEDLMAFVDYVEKWDWVDKARVGVIGGSYGGFMTNWIIGHTNRFKAAVTQRSISNWNSFTGVSDIGYFFAENEHNLNFVKDQKELTCISPITYVEMIDTPLLIIHGEHDYRCPVEQAEQLFIHLKFLRKTVRLSIFPGSNHNLSRNGKPELRVERLKQIAGWFDQYL